MASGEAPRIGFLGAGQMATALARGWLTAGLATADRVLASDLVPNARKAFQDVTGAKGVTIRNCRIEDVGIAVNAQYAGSQDFYITDNVMLGRDDHRHGGRRGHPRLHHAVAGPATWTGRSGRRLTDRVDQQSAGLQAGGHSH